MLDISDVKRWFIADYIDRVDYLLYAAGDFEV